MNKKPIIVYRIQNDRKVGPFNANFYVSLLNKNTMLADQWRDHMNNFPAIQEDFDTYSEEYYCACHQLELIKEWFGQFLDELAQKKFFMAVYQTSDYYISKSGKQVIFNLDESIMIEAKSLA